MAERPVYSSIRLPAWVELLLLALILAVSFAVRWPFRNILLIRDEGEYAYAGQQILRGAIPYLDVYNQKTPFTFYLLGAFQWLAGPDLASLRVATSIYGLLTTVVLYLLVRRLFSPATGLVAALAFALMTFDQCGIFYSASTEFFMLLWIALALYCWYVGRERTRGWLLFVAGAAAGLAYQTKQTGLAIFVFLLLERLWSWLRDRTGPGRLDLFRDLSFVGLGFAIVLGIVVAYFAAHGAAQAYVECTWSNNWQYVGHRHQGLAALTKAFGRAGYAAGWDLGLWIWGAAGLIALAWTRPPSPASGLWMLLVLTAGAALVAGQPYAHYYEPMIVPLAIGNAVAAVWLGRELAVHRSRLALAALLAAGLIAPWLWPAVHWGQSFLMTEAERSRLNEQFPLFAAAPNVARHLAERTGPAESFLIVGSEPEIYYYAERKASTRLVFTYPLTGPYHYASRLREEFQRDLVDRLPHYVVLVQDPASLTEWSANLPALLDPVTQLLERDYVLEAAFPESTNGVPLFAVFRRRDAAFLPGK